MELLYSAFILLAAGVLSVPVAQRLGMGSVLGYLIAGVLIGPDVFNLLGGMADHMMEFAEFGVVMMLFLIGLELHPELLWRMRGPIIGMGGLQVVITVAAIAGVAILLDQHWKHALIIGLVLSLSSTAIALQILSEKHLLKTEGGRSGFAVLLFQDIAVIPIIALLPLLSIRGDMKETEMAHSLISDYPQWQQALIVIATLLGIILIGRFLTRPLFRFIAQSRLREMFTATALLLVIGIALLMESVGLSPALGTFLAGVVLANSEYRHELEANIDPFKALLLGLFFISIGASIDFDLLRQKPWVVSGIVAGLVFLKFAILIVLALFFRIRGSDRYWFAFTLAQGGEFGFVLLSIIADNYMLPSFTIDILVLSIALSMVLTPLLILLNEKLVQPRFKRFRQKPVKEETIDEHDNPVIVAGFGRFGQIVTRLLIANRIPVTVLDHSAAHIERVRQFGFKIYYGDARREDLLHTAGAENASLLVVAVDDRDTINQIVMMAKHNFPHLKIFARAYDVNHFYDLKSMGVDHIERELFLGSLNVGEKALHALGARAWQARRRALQFAKHDRHTIEMLEQHRGDTKRYISEIQRARAEVVEILLAERRSSRSEVPDHAWDSTGHE